MTPAPEAAHAWRAHVRLTFELERIGAIGRVPSLRAQLLGTSSHWALVLVQNQGGAR